MTWDEEYQDRVQDRIEEASREQAAEYARFPTLDAWLAALWQRKLPAVPEWLYWRNLEETRTDHYHQLPGCLSLVNPERQAAFLACFKRLAARPRPCRDCQRPFVPTSSTPKAVRCRHCLQLRAAARRASEESPS